MFKSPRWYRKSVTVPLYKIKRATPPFVWFIALMLTCFLFPFVASIKLVHPGLVLTLVEAWRVAQADWVSAVVFCSFFLFMLSWFTFIINGAFLFTRALAGLETRKNSSVLKWSYFKIKRALN